MTEAPRSPAPAIGATRPVRAPSHLEFVALMAMMFATVALSIDAMLPALPRIAAEISPAAPNRAQLVITSFVLGLGLGTMVTGPLSDSFGRKPVVVYGAVLFVLGAASAWAAPNLETMIAARIVQGLGAAAPRVVGMAIIRDMFAGRRMARLMSFIMLVFTLIPALAPSLGAAVTSVAGWRAIFPVFIGFSLVATGWLVLRQPETLPAEDRRPFQAAPLLAGVREILTTRVVVLSIAALSLGFGTLFATLSSTQQVFDQTFGRGDTFHLWFGAIALIAGSSGLINAALVMRLGMRFMVTVVIGVQVVLSGGAAALFASGMVSPQMAFVVYVLWSIGIFAQAGLTIGNLNAMAMEPMGHLAGLTASVVGSISTVLAAVLAIPIGLAFDGTPVPLTFGSMLLSMTALFFIVKLHRS